MNPEKEKTCLRIYLATTDQIDHQIAYEYLVKLAQKNNMAGVTVMRGIMGYGASSRLHTSRFWELTEKLPVVLELVDEKDKTETFFRLIEPLLNSMDKGCMVTSHPVEVLVYKKGL